MCGITGFLDFKGNSIPVDSLRALNDAMQHRGPDDAGVFNEGPVGLAMRRLSIIDLGGGHQPMQSESGRFVIVFNGECYNYREVRAELEGLGCRFRTHSDTEVLLVGFEQWGPAILDRLVGMWGIAIWDRQQKELFLARDRIGKKQLYYSLDGGGLVFASEMSVVLQARADNRLNLAALSEFLTYSYIGGPQTAVSGVSLLPAGHWAKVSTAGQWEVRCYWRPSATATSTCDETEAAETAYRMVVDATRLRLAAADVPVSVMLSSGLDSSTIAYVLARELGAKLHTFSLGFGDADFDEAADAGALARQMGFAWQQTVVTGADVARDFSRLIAHGSSLQANTAQIVYFYTNQLIRQNGFKVAINGNGGDELFAGYPTYRATYFYGGYRHIPSFLRAGLRRAVGHLPASLGRVSFDYVAKKFTACTAPDPLSAHGYWRTIFSPEELSSLLSPAASAHRQSFTSIYDRAIGELGATDATINHLLQADLLAWLVPMLPWSDNMSMAHSVELRFPFLDHRLIEFAHRLPPGVLFRGWKLKRVMKRFLHGRIPDDVLHRKKRGTHVPLGRWLNTDLREIARHYLDEAVLNRNGLFNMAFVRSLVAEHAARRADHTFKLWNLIVFSAWSETFRIRA